MAGLGEDMRALPLGTCLVSTQSDGAQRSTATLSAQARPELVIVGIRP